jgi:hypothetical protein
MGICLLVFGAFLQHDNALLSPSILSMNFTLTSNQALELTATRCAFTFSMIKTFSPQLTLGSGSRSSAYSR